MSEFTTVVHHGQQWGYFTWIICDKVADNFYSPEPKRGLSMIMRILVQSLTTIKLNLINSRYMYIPEGGAVCGLTRDLAESSPI